MRVLFLLVVALSVGCQGISPEVAAPLKQAVGDAAVALSTGNLAGAAWTLGIGVVGAAGMWLRKRAKNSKPGEILGGSGE